MTFIVLFEDNPDADPAIRSTHMAEHLDFLEAHASQISAAGPLTGLDHTAAGGLWIVEGADATAVQGLVEADPFWPTGLRQKVTILHWRQVFADGKRQSAR
jgi:uncharacterized protein YciI